MLSIGRLDPIKRLDDVVTALAEPCMSEAVLHVIGRGDDRERLESLAQRLNVAPRVHFHGWQDDAASNAMMAGCDVMVLASAREGMPTVVFEALLAGVPIACSDIDGNRSITQAVGWDALFALGDIPALASCVLATANREVPQTVREAVRSGFTWGGQAPRLAARYLDLAQKQQAAPGWHRRIARALTNYDDPRSLAHGCVLVAWHRYWRLLSDDFLSSRSVSITIVNLHPVALPPDDPRFTFMVADGCDLSEIPSGAFHIAHSNSVIEHVGDQAHGQFCQRASASCRRLLHPDAGLLVPG